MSSSVLKAPGHWTLNHLYRRTSTNERIVSVVKLGHPTRRQRIVLIPCPRIGNQAFYVDWVYQPYLKDNQIMLNFDIFNPFYIWPARVLVERNQAKYGDLRWFNLLRMPGPGEQDIQRAILKKRTKISRPSWLTQMLVPSAIRDSKTKYTTKFLAKLVGESYLTHPSREVEGSFVLILPPLQAVAAMEKLGELGFEVADSTDAVVGDAEKIEELEGACCNGELLALGYLWLNLLGAIYVIGSWISDHVCRFRDDYYANRTTKIRELITSGVLTEEEGEKLILRAQAAPDAKPTAERAV